MTCAARERQTAWPSSSNARSQRQPSPFSSSIRARIRLVSEAVDTLLAAVTILPFGAEEATLAAGLRQKRESAGEPIGMADYLIAAICITHASTLLTHNLKHFKRINGLRISGLHT